MRRSSCNIGGRWPGSATDAGSQWATTLFAEAGFVTISSNASAMPSAVTPTEAVALLDRMRQVWGHQFLTDDVAMIVGEYLNPERVATYRWVMDAHLLALARRHGARLATLDRGIAGLASGEDLVLAPVA